MIKMIFSAFIILSLLCSDATPAAGQVDLQPLVADSRQAEVARIVDLEPTEAQQLTEAIAYTQAKVDQLWDLDRKHPNEGWDKLALKLAYRIQQLRETPVRRGTIDDPVVRGYVLWGGTIYLNPPAFWDDAQLGGSLPAGASPEAQRKAAENQRNLRGARVMDLALVGLHEVPHSRFSPLTRRLSIHGGEQEAWSEEYVFFRIMTALDPAFKVHSEQEGAIRDGLQEYGLKPGTELDRQLGIPERLDRLNATPPSATASGPTAVKLDFLQDFSTSGSIGRSYHSPMPAKAPDAAGARVDITVPNAGRLFLKLEFASDQSSGPRFYGDELGYRGYAFARITYNGGKTERPTFNNKYDKNFAAITTTLNLSNAQTVTIQIFPQGATAINPETWTSDGKNYLYFAGRYKVYANFAGK